MRGGSKGGCARGQACRCQHPTTVGQPAHLRGGAQQGAPLDLDADDINNLVGQADDILVAEVDGDAGLLLLQVSGRIRATLADVLRVVGGLCEGDHLVVGDGHRRVVAHDERRSEGRTAAAERRADMLMQRHAAIVGEVRSCVAMFLALVRKRRRPMSGQAQVQIQRQPDHQTRLFGNTTAAPRRRRRLCHTCP